MFSRQVDFTAIYEADGEIDDRDLEKEFDHIVAEGNAIKDANIHASAAIAQSKISNVARAIDADKVDGFNADSTPAASTLLPLDADKHYPVSVIEDGTLPIAKLKIYETSEQAIVVDTTYTYEHGLGAIPKIIQLWVSEEADGSGWCVSPPTGPNYHVDREYDCGTGVVAYSTTEIKIRTGQLYLVLFRDKDGDTQLPESGFLRIIAFA